MPVLGVPASLGRPEQLSAKSAGGRYACASVNGQRDARESGVTPLLPRNCKRRLSKSGRPLPHGGKVSGAKSQSQETDRAADVHVPLPRGRRIVMKVFRSSLRLRSSCKLTIHSSPRTQSASALSLATVVLFLLSLASLSFAADTGSIRGVITDPAGALVPGATVELLRGDTRAATVITDATGSYWFSGVAPGRYT